MRRLAPLVAAAVALVTSLVAAPPARADGSEGTALGIGAASTITGLAGPEIAYQTSRWHAEGILGFHDDGVTEIDLAARFWWEINQTAASDFSLGGGLGIQSVDLGPETDNDLHLELGAQIRAFLASSFAVSATLGVGLENGDDNDDSDVMFLNAQLIGSMGVTYFFF